VIEVGEQDGVTLLRLAAGKANAMSLDFCEALTARIAAASSARAVVLTGTGRIFSAGVDLLRLLACAADRRLMGRDCGRIGVTELLVGVPFPPAAMEIMRCATAPQFFAEAIFGGETYSPIDAVGRGWIHDLADPEALIDRALEAANRLAALPGKAFALSKRQTREPALERMQNREIDAAIEQIWTAPETLERVRDYVARTLRK
jgi:enoyl-CoA hydratase